MKKSLKYYIEKMHDEEKEGHGKDPNIQKKIADFFLSKKGAIDDETDVHTFASELGIEKSELEEEIYAMLKAFISGGNFNKKGIDPSTFDPEEVKMGIEVEKEHSDNMYIRLRITYDHLSDNPKYYSEGKAKGIFDELKD